MIQQSGLPRNRGAKEGQGNLKVLSDNFSEALIAVYYRQGAK